MRFGQEIRRLRQEMELSQRDLAKRVGVTFTYISKIENQKLDFGDYPSEEMICKLAEALDGDEDALLILAQKIPQQIRQRVLERPDVFHKIAELDDTALDGLLQHVDGRQKRGRRKSKPR